MKKKIRIYIYKKLQRKKLSLTTVLLFCKKMNCRKKKFEKKSYLKIYEKCMDKIKMCYGKKKVL